MEPQAALADVKPDEATIYVSTQAANQVLDRVSRLVDLPKEKVRIVPLYVGGGFGRKHGSASGTEAARLSAAVGRPVHVGWNRMEEMRYGFLRPLAHSFSRQVRHRWVIIVDNRNNSTCDFPR